MIDFKDITPLGGGLKILINANYDQNHDWMTFASWYSITKNLPDAQIKILCKRELPIKQMFNWPNRCKVDFSFSTFSDENEYFHITPDVMAVAEFMKNSVGPIDCKISELSTFVSYSNGCAAYNSNTGCPFANSQKFFTEQISFNEYRILKLWDKANIAYINTA